jgi:hypothetical protein
MITTVSGSLLLDKFLAHLGKPFRFRRQRIVSGGDVNDVRAHLAETPASVTVVGEEFTRGDAINQEEVRGARTISGAEHASHDATGNFAAVQFPRLFCGYQAA